VQVGVEEKDALATKHLVFRLDTGKRVVIQDNLYSRFAKHVETVCLEIPRRFQSCIEGAYNDKQDISFRHEGSAL
jgi:hypothetical protein